ncbi:free fatty acid receptor 2-like [Sinocyclocheilus anshuiensis]|uniref:free fatty acid receptor 2-like n=1 Tax=Sinocyclocheilus anshuiensis TaxID=1608454 RepID=UPI0007B926FE|nr:PREDICTED: free fatty acid receptor 2-like [Sinocyclocheilus anshuiensis]
MINHWVILAVYILTFLIGLPANLLAICTFFKKLGDKPSPNDILLFNLTASDLVFLLFLPFKMYEAAVGMKWYLSQTLCSIASYVFFTTIYTSSLLLMAIAIDRYIGLGFPFKYRLLRKPLYATAGSVIIWLVSAAHCSIVFITVHMPDLNATLPKTVCYENFTEKQKKILLPFRLEMFMVLYILPLLVCIFCYINCIYILYSRPHISKEKKQRAIGMALCTLTIFLLCFLPYNSSHLVGFSSYNSPSWRYYTLLPTTLNTCLDPFVFYFSSSTFRESKTVSLLKRWCFRHKKTKKSATELGIVAK